MDAKHRLVQFVAALGLVAAGLLCLAALNRFRVFALFDSWVGIDSLFLFALGSYFIARAMRAWYWATGKTHGKTGGLHWGKILLGSWLIYSLIKGHFDPSPNLFKPSNASQAAGANFASILIAALGTWLLGTGIRSGFTQRTPHMTDGLESSMFTRPKGVTIIAVLLFVGGLSTLLLPGGIRFRGIGTIRGPWVLAFCSFYLVVGIGLLRLSRWARTTTIILMILDLALIAVALRSGLLQNRLMLLTTYLLGIPFYGLTLWYLLKPEVRLAFAEKTTEQKPLSLASQDSSGASGQPP